MVFKRGHKSQALRLLGVLFGVMASIGMVAYFMNFSTEQTKKVSFKAAGVKYKEQLTVVSLPDTPIEQKQRPKKYERTVLKKVFVNGTDYFMSLKVKELTNTSSNRVVKHPIETMKISSDLQVLSSFDCVKDLHQPSFVTFRT